MSTRRRGSEKVGWDGNLDSTRSRTFWKCSSKRKPRKSFSPISFFLGRATPALNNFQSVRTSYNRVTICKIFVTFPQHALSRTLLLGEPSLPEQLQIPQTPELFFVS